MPNDRPTADWKFWTWRRRMIAAELRYAQLRSEGIMAAFTKDGIAIYQGSGMPKLTIHRADLQMFFDGDFKVRSFND